MKRNLLLTVLLCATSLFGCQSNQVEPVEENVAYATEDTTEEERQAHIDEIRKSINGDQEEISTEEYFEQQRQREHERNLEKAKEMREVNETLADIFRGNTTPTPQQPKEPESELLKEIGEARGIKIQQGLTYDNFLMVGDQDFFTLNSINELFGIKGKLVSEFGDHKTYQWEEGDKFVTIAFTRGIAGSKTQVGL